MPDNKTLREQVAEAINCVFNAAFERKDGVWPSSEAADAAIKAVLEGMRCKYCAHWSAPWSTTPYPGTGLCMFPEERKKSGEWVVVEESGPSDGCIHWEQKQ